MDLELSLDKNRNKKSVNKDFFHNVNFERSTILLPVSESSSVVNSYKVYEDEKDKSEKFRLNVTLNPIMTNVLCNRLTDVIRKSSNSLVLGEERFNAIQNIDTDTFYYRVGYDIMDNHFMRVDSFKTGNTLNDFTGIELFNAKTIEESITNNLIDDNGWIGITNKTKIGNNRMFKDKKPCEKINFFPSKEFLSFKPSYINNELIENWSFDLTYPFENYTANRLVTDDNGINGIPTISLSIVFQNGSSYLQVTTAYKHGLKPNDVIKIKTNSKYDNNTYLVYDVGDINHKNKESTFIIDANKYTGLSLYDNKTEARIVRIINRIESKYYIRKFKKVPNLIDVNFQVTEDNFEEVIKNVDNTFLSEEYQPAFSRNIYNDPLYQIQYIDDIDLSYLKDNLGRPISEIYLTVIKKNIYKSSYIKGLFTSVTSGIDISTGFTGFYNIHKINSVDLLEEPLETDITTNGSFINGIQSEKCFLGDIVEYNESIVKETKLEDIYHRFNTTQREEDNYFTYSDFYGDDTNLLLYSNFKDIPVIGNELKYWKTLKSTIEIPTGNTYVDGERTRCLSCKLGTTAYTGCYNNQGILFEKGKEYFISFFARSNTNGTILDWVGVESKTNPNGNYVGEYNHYVIGDNDFLLTIGWKRYVINFIGDGKKHSLIFGVRNNIDALRTIDITKIKVEEKLHDSDEPSKWSLNPIEGDYKFVNKSIKLDPLKEGYYYKPHHRVELKKYSETLSSEQFIEIERCDDNITFGITKLDNLLASIRYYNDDEISYLAIKIKDSTLLKTFDYVRITDNTTKKYINKRISILTGSKNIILIPYDRDFFGSVQDINSNVTIRKFNQRTVLYAQDAYNGMCSWRDISKIEFPFTNGRFYTSENFIFYLMRQDPFGYYGIRNEKFPSDIFGSEIEVDITNNIEEKSNDIC